MKTDLVVAGYIFDNDRLLLIEHKKLNLWLPVGGHIDENEIPDDALKREIIEETGLEVDILNQSDLKVRGNVKMYLANPFNVNVHSVGDHDHCCFFYLCRAKNPNDLNINSELKNYQWHTKEELEGEHVPEDVRDLGKKAFKLMNL